MPTVRAAGRAGGTTMVITSKALMMVSRVLYFLVDRMTSV